MKIDKEKWRNRLPRHPVFQSGFFLFLSGRDLIHDKNPSQKLVFVCLVIFLRILPL